jgi:HTH-type transcriptional regulator, competence development regulator
MTLGERLKLARTAKRMSLRDVERETEGRISNGYLSLVESGEVKQPSPNHLHRLAKVLGLEYSELMALAGFHVPASTRAGTRGLTGLAFSAKDLTADERADVEKYIEFVRSKRANKPSRKP